MSFAVPTDFSQTTTSQFEPIPADNHIGVCIGVIDLGTHEEQFPGSPMKKVRKIKLQFELPGVERTDGKAGIISTTFNYSLHEKANFRKTMDAWLGNDWPEKNKGKSWAFLIGVPAMVNVESGPGKRDANKTVTWVEGITKFPKGLPAPKPTRETFWLDLSEKRLPAVLSRWDADKIRASAEYLAGGFTDDAPREDGSTSGNAPSAGGKPPWVPEKAAAGFASKPCPPLVGEVLARIGLSWPFRVSDIPDSISSGDLQVIESYSLPDF